MSRIKPILNDFFSAYAKRVNDALADPRALDVTAMRAAFADYFVRADPNEDLRLDHAGRGEGADAGLT